MQESNIKKGILRWLSAKKDFAFIEQKEENATFMVTRPIIRDLQLDTIDDGDFVAFETLPGEQRHIAKNVHPL